MERSAEFDLAISLADEARRLALEGFRHARLEKNKSPDGFDPTTDRDIAIEKMMHERIATDFPDHAVQGEELPATNSGAKKIWVIDPIDGTRNYYAGSLFWGILIAFLEGDEIQFGIIDHPPTGERFIANRSSGLWIKDKETKVLKTKSTTILKEAVLAATTPQMFQPDELEAFNAISDEAAITLYGGNCYFYGLLALGQIDCVIEASLQPYDIAALIPVVEAAGGVITNWQGRHALSSNTGGGRGTRSTRGTRVVASANQTLHELLLNKLSGTSA